MTSKHYTLLESLDDNNINKLINDVLKGKESLHRIIHLIGFDGSVYVVLEDVEYKGLTLRKGDVTTFPIEGKTREYKIKL